MPTDKIRHIGKRRRGNVMIEAILNSLCAVAVVAVVAGVGFYFAHKGTFNEQSRALIAKLVNI